MISSSSWLEGTVVSKCSPGRPVHRSGLKGLGRKVSVFSFGLALCLAGPGALLFANKGGSF